MINYETHGGAEPAGKQQERICLYESRMKEMVAKRKENGGSDAGKEQEEK